VILATGFRDLGVDEQAERCPSILESLYGQIQSDPSGVIEIARDYRLTPKTVNALGPLYLNGLCESSHGYGDAGSFSLLALRSQEILNSLLQQLPNVLTKTATELVEA
jgi:L-ornithine N5-oxygenase